MNVTGFRFSGGKKYKNERAGFIALNAETENIVLSSLHEEFQDEFSKVKRKCPFDDAKLPVLFKMVFYAKNATKKPRNAHKIKEVGDADEGLYEVSFVHCDGASEVEFHFESHMYNEGGNYLPYGETSVPSILFAFSCLFGVALGVWVAYVKKHKLRAHKVHHLMTVLLVFKMLSLLARSIDMHYIKMNGYSVVWNFLYHTFRAFKAIMFFLVVILIGTGWSLLKPALNPRERKFLLFVLPMQVLANIALEIADELPKGSTAFMRWRDIFLMVDLVCCLAVAVPIFAHIQHLERQTDIDSKAEVNLAKLKQFRRFYLLVLFYVYFSRVVIFLVGNSMNFKHRWVETLLREGLALIFYVVIGYSFKPTNENLYLKVATGEGEYEPDRMSSVGGDLDDDPFHEDYFFNADDEHQNQYGLDDDDDHAVEMSSVRKE
uniref:GOST seven transmembrane domain-containing protein n=1 Tax=Mucochytrium quahogii TaxID=96639 RepID=A0A7S2S266_9STRA